MDIGRQGYTLSVTGSRRVPSFDLQYGEYNGTLYIGMNAFQYPGLRLSNVVGEYQDGILDRVDGTLHISDHTTRVSIQRIQER